MASKHKSKLFGKIAALARSRNVQLPMVPDDRSPAIRLEKILFSDGTELKLEDDAIVVLCGPNNVGKTAALHDIWNILEDGKPGIIVNSVLYERIGSLEALKTLLNKHSHPDTSFRDVLLGVGFKIFSSYIKDSWNSSGALGPLTGFFCSFLDTVTRITDSNPTDSVAILAEANTHPIHLAQRDQSVAAALSVHFREAFGRDLIINHGAGSKVLFYVGKAPVVTAEKNPVTQEYLRELETLAKPLHLQGDGMRSFATIMLRITSSTHRNILFIDEPEAFLHPPQAKIIGQFIRAEQGQGVQILIATHSSEILQGLVSTNAPNLHILRIDRDGDDAKISLLPQESLRSLWADPVIRYSNVLGGIFHKRVIICESEADCMFYNAMQDATISRDAHPDVLFVSSNGKHGLNKIASALKAVGTPVSAIVDFDILNAEHPLRAIVEALGGSWSEIEPLWKKLKTSVEAKKPLFRPSELIGEIGRLAEKSSAATTRDLKREVEAIFSKASPWDNIEKSGAEGLSSGEPTLTFQIMNEMLKSIGLFIVPVGELEGFCRVIGGKGGAFVRNVLESQDLAQSPLLSRARDFMAEIAEI